MSVFAPFKHHINEDLYKNASSTDSTFHPGISFFDLCRVFRKAYDLALLEETFAKVLKNRGVALLSSKAPLSTSS